MAKRGKSPGPRSRSSAEPGGRPPRRGIVHTSVYLPDAVYEALREAAFNERRKIHDIVLEGIELALRKRRARN
jgi:hypothetical protein